jgi:hypothetical protein
VGEGWREEVRGCLEASLKKKEKKGKEKKVNKPNRKR